MGESEDHYFGVWEREAKISPVAQHRTKGGVCKRRLKNTTGLFFLFRTDNGHSACVIAEPDSLDGPVKRTWTEGSRDNTVVVTARESPGQIKSVSRGDHGADWCWRISCCNAPARHEHVSKLRRVLMGSPPPHPHPCPAQ